MNAPGNLDWLFALVGWTLGVGGVVLLTWALFWDRPKGRRRCPKCWYDMAGIAGLRCPECGEEATSERYFRRTRRRKWLAAAAALVILMGIACERWPRFSRGGWINAVPSWTLILIAPSREPTRVVWTPTASSTPGGLATRFALPPELDAPDPLSERLYDAAWQRVANGDMWLWESRFYVARCFRNDPQFDPRTTFKVPAIWPAGERVPVSADVVLPRTLRVEFRFDDQEWQGPGRRSSDQVLIGPASRPAPSLGFRVMRNDDMIHEGHVPTQLVQRGTKDDFLDKVDTPDVTSRVAKALRASLALIDGYPVVEHGDLPKNESWGGGLDGRLFFTVDLRVNGRVVASGAGETLTFRQEGDVRRVYLEGTDISAPTGPRPDVGPMTPGNFTSAHAELIIRGDVRSASRFYRSFWPGPLSGACWTGEFVVPIESVPERGTRGSNQTPAAPGTLFNRH